MTSLVRDQASQAATAREVSRFAAEEFERIAALSQALSELMLTLRFYQSPALAAAQIATIAKVAESAAATVDAMAFGAGIERTDERMEAVLDAHQRFLDACRNPS